MLLRRAIQAKMSIKRRAQQAIFNANRVSSFSSAGILNFIIGV